MTNPVVYIFLNESLHMSAGKCAAQAAHAAMMVSSKDYESWQDEAHRTIIVLKARDESHIRNIERYLLQRGFASHPIIDEGANEIEPHTITALSTNIIDKDDHYVEKTFSTFELYRDKIKIKLEIDR